jgi:predicted enzyme related to lactoylglutathione lyase
MPNTIESLTFDCADPATLAEFWAALLGWSVTDEEDDPDEEVLLEPPTPGPTPILFIKVPDTKSMKNRLHYDLRPDDQAAEVERALSLGATHVDIGQGEQTWVVLADPEGNEFCILSSRNRSS